MFSITAFAKRQALVEHVTGNIPEPMTSDQPIKRLVGFDSAPVWMSPESIPMSVDGIATK